MVQFNNLCIGDGPQVYNLYLGDGPVQQSMFRRWSRFGWGWIWKDKYNTQCLPSCSTGFCTGCPTKYDNTVITRKLWNKKTTFKLKLWLKIVKFRWNTAIVQCKQTHFTEYVIWLIAMYCYILEKQLKMQFSIAFLSSSFPQFSGYHCIEIILYFTEMNKFNL